MISCRIHSNNNDDDINNNNNNNNNSSIYRRAYIFDEPIFLSISYFDERIYG